MTDIIGRWKIKEALRFNDQFERIWISRESILNDAELHEDEKQFIKMEIIFTADGLLKVVMPLPADVPPEEVKAAVQAGELRLYDDSTMLLEEHPWQIQDGRLLYDTGRPAATAGETPSSWEEIPIENGMLHFRSFHLTKTSHQGLCP